MSVFLPNDSEKDRETSVVPTSKNLNSQWEESFSGWAPGLWGWRQPVPRPRGRPSLSRRDLTTALDKSSHFHTNGIHTGCRLIFAECKPGPVASYFQLLREKQAQTNSSDRAPTPLSRIVPAPLLTRPHRLTALDVTCTLFLSLEYPPILQSTLRGASANTASSHSTLNLSLHIPVCSVHDCLAPSQPDCGFHQCRTCDFLSPTSTTMASPISLPALLNPPGKR